MFQRESNPTLQQAPLFIFVQSYLLPMGTTIGGTSTNKLHIPPFMGCQAWLLENELSII